MFKFITDFFRHKRHEEEFFLEEFLSGDNIMLRLVVCNFGEIDYTGHVIFVEVEIVLDEDINLTFVRDFCLLDKAKEKIKNMKKITESHASKIYAMFGKKLRHIIDVYILPYQKYITWYINEDQRYQLYLLKKGSLPVCAILSLPPKNYASSMLVLKYYLSDLVSQKEIDAVRNRFKDREENEENEESSFLHSIAKQSMEDLISKIKNFCAYLEA